MRKAVNLPPSCAVITKSGNLNFLEPSGPVQACNGTALPLQIDSCDRQESFLAILQALTNVLKHNSKVLAIVSNL